jgi:hypothetical protein
MYEASAKANNASKANEYPSKPNKPRLQDTHTVEEVLAYVDNLRLYEQAMEVWTVARDAYYARSHEIAEQFRKDLEEEHSMTGHPKADKLYAKAWEDGHSAGFAEVENVYSDLIELVK